MTIVLNTLTNPLNIAGATQTFTATQPSSYLEIKQTISPTSTVSPSTGIKMTSVSGDALILQNTATTSGSSQSLAFVTNGGTTTTILGATNGSVIANFGTLTTTASATIGTTLAVTGSTSLTTLNTSSNASVGGTLNVTGASTLTTGTLATSGSTATSLVNKSYVDSATATILNNYLTASVSVGYTGASFGTDYIKFNTITDQRQSNSPYISLDTTSTYTTALNTAGLGRLTLRANKVYRITAYIIMYASSTGGFCQLIWRNVDSGAWCANPDSSGSAPQSASAFYISPLLSGSTTAQGSNSFIYKVGSSDTRIALYLYVSSGSGTWTIYGQDSAICTRLIVEQIS